MRAAVEGFTGLEHALEPVGRNRRRAVRQRLEGDQHRGGAARDRELRRGLVVIIGGRFKGGDFGDLRRAAGERAGRASWRSARRRRSSRRRSRARCRVHDAADMRDAVRTAFAAAAPGGMVLLAPACASFDMFRDYAERGRVFKQEARKLRRSGTARVSSERSSAPAMR